MYYQVNNNKTLINFLSMSFHFFNFCIGVHHLIVFETNRLNESKAFLTSICLVRLPVHPSFFAAPAFSCSHLAVAQIFVFTYGLAIKSHRYWADGCSLQKKRKTRDANPRPHPRSKLIDDLDRSTTAGRQLLR